MFRLPAWLFLFWFVVNAPIRSLQFTPVPDASIFVGNLAFSTTEQDLHTAFGAFGRM